MKKESIFLLIRIFVIGLVGLVISRFLKNVYVDLAITLLYFIFAIVVIIKQESDIKNITEIDTTLNVMTKGKFFVEVNKKLKRAKPNEYMLLSFDIDNFKQYNQLHGYEKGNEILKIFVSNIKKCIGENNIIARDSQDVFIVFAKNTFNGVSICQYDPCKRCIENGLKEDLEIESLFGISKGVYIIRDPKLSLDLMIDCCSSARLQGKGTYGTTMHVYTEAIENMEELEREIVCTMERALNNKEFFFVIQPKYDLLNGNIVGGEALIRWKKQDGSLVMPNSFIPIFEKTGFIVKIDHFMFEEVCKLISSSKVKLPVISVNMSSVTASAIGSIEFYKDTVKKYKIDPKQIEIEITETALAEQFQKNYINISKLKEIGFSVSIDDFGTGVSTLARLLEADVDIIKLDRSFVVSGLSANKSDSILQTVISMSKKMNMTVVAEGIEEENQWERLVDYGCDIGQGYIFDKPLEVAKFVEFVENKKLVTRQNDICVATNINGYLADFEKLPLGILLCKDDEFFSILKGNDKAFEILTYSREQMRDIYQNKLTKIISTKLSEAYFRRLNLKEEENQTVETKFEIKTSDGKVKQIYDVAKFDRTNNLFYVIIKDVTNIEDRNC